MPSENHSDLPPDVASLRSIAADAARFAESLVGMPYEEAQRMAESRGCFVQKLTDDSGPVTTDIKFDRIRCYVNDRGIVMEAHSG
jgi:hypothetical protein